MTAYGMRSSYWSSDVCSSDRVAYADKAAEHYAYTPAAKGRRRLRNVALDYIAAADPQAGAALAFAQLEGTDNMTDRQAALTTLASGIYNARVTAPDISYTDRKSVVSGKSVSVRVAIGGRRLIKKKKQKKETT